MKIDGQRRTLTGRMQDFTWHLTNVYAPNDCKEREATLGELASAKGLFSGSWFLCWDLTLQYFHHKRRKGPESQKNTDFAEFISLKIWAKWIWC